MSRRQMAVNLKDANTTPLSRPAAMIPVPHIVPLKVRFKARALHRWARQKKWPGIALSAISQDFSGLGSHSHCGETSDLASQLTDIGAHGLHVIALYVAITLLM